MQRVNPEGLYATVQAVLPHLKKNPGGKGRIIVVSPPIYSRFFRGKTAYAMGKVGMSVLTKGLAMDFEREGLNNMAITSIWPAAVSSALKLISIEFTDILYSSPSSQQLQSNSQSSTQITKRIYARLPFSRMLYWQCYRRPRR